ncbi:hypothetical protein M8818_006450 [Zalaria obscura]|uniref:Uncharacterized protein n=1 Tax=Zalaria obscura TaxID=2024903 RepID=A0ACC3S7M9_9PEZI
MRQAIVKGHGADRNSGGTPPVYVRSVSVGGQNYERVTMQPYISDWRFAWLASSGGFFRASFRWTTQRPQ